MKYLELDLENRCRKYIFNYYESEFEIAKEAEQKHIKVVNEFVSADLFDRYTSYGDGGCFIPSLEDIKHVETDDELAWFEVIEDSEFILSNRRFAINVDGLKVTEIYTQCLHMIFDENGICSNCEGTGNCQICSKYMSQGICGKICYWINTLLSLNVKCTLCEGKRSCIQCSGVKNCMSCRNSKFIGWRKLWVDEPEAPEDN